MPVPDRNRHRIRPAHRHRRRHHLPKPVRFGIESLQQGPVRFIHIKPPPRTPRIADIASHNRQQIPGNRIELPMIDVPPSHRKVGQKPARPRRPMPRRILFQHQSRRRGTRVVVPVLHHIPNRRRDRKTLHILARQWIARTINKGRRHLESIGTRLQRRRSHTVRCTQPAAVSITRNRVHHVVRIVERTVNPGMPQLEVASVDHRCRHQLFGKTQGEPINQSRTTRPFGRQRRTKNLRRNDVRRINVQLVNRHQPKTPRRSSDSRKICIIRPSRHRMRQLTRPARYKNSRRIVNLQRRHQRTRSRLRQLQRQHRPRALDT